MPNDRRQTARRPFDAVRDALADGSSDARIETAAGPRQSDPEIRVDSGRTARTGIPEVVLAGPKSSEMVAVALSRLALRAGRAVATRCTVDQLAEVPLLLDGRLSVETFADAAAMVAFLPDSLRVSCGGLIGIITAGTSDLRTAAEAALIANEMGCDELRVQDVGVAGLHRLVQPLESLTAAGVDVLVVVAGMDGALPSVVAGLVDVPVIGIPTSTGYGFGGDGTAALMSMLQSCAPGLTVVNIDNGVGGGAAAARIANRIAAARLASDSPRS